MRRANRKEFSDYLSDLGKMNEHVSTKVPASGILEYYRRVEGQEDELVGVLVDKAGTVTRYLA